VISRRIVSSCAIVGAVIAAAGGSAAIGRDGQAARTSPLASITGPARAVTRLPWDRATQGLPVLTVGQHDVWIGSIILKPAAPTVWRVDPVRATVRPTPLTEQLLDIFPGDGTLWVSAQPSHDGLLVYWVDIAHAFRLVEKAVPHTCRTGDGGHSAVYRGKLWLTCSRYGIYVFARGERRPTQRLRQQKLGPLLPASNGLWAASERSLRAVAGKSRGTVIPLPHGFVVAGDYASNLGWSVAGATAWAIGLGPTADPELVRIDLNRRVATAFPIVAPVGRDGYLGGGIAVAGDEIWLGDSQHVRLIRYSGAHPDKPVGYITLPGHGRSPLVYFQLQGGAGAAWADAEGPSGAALYRVAINK
jgi:hypothetical protein